MQDFTRGAFSWYLALVKGETHEESRFLAGQLFLSLLELLSPIIPEFISMIEGVLKFPVKSVVNREELHGVKDYRTFLLFDILKGIQLKRAELQLKKHLPIALCVQANSDILRLIESYESSLKLLFKTEEIQYLAANEVFPSGFETFMILDITVGIKALDLPQHEDYLAQLEKEHASKLQTLEYLRSTLVALSLNPLADPVKLAEKESELDQLKSEIQELELNIKKMKATKKV